MKKLLFTLAFAVLGFTASYAQKPVKHKFTAEEKAEKAASALQQKLSLSNEQKARIQKIELDRFKQHEEWRKNNATDVKAKFEKRKASMKAHQDKINAVLTPEQQKTFSASQEEMKQKMKDRKGRSKHGKHGKRGERGERLERSAKEQAPKTETGS